MESVQLEDKLEDFYDRLFSVYIPKRSSSVLYWLQLWSKVNEKPSGQKPGQCRGFLPQPWQTYSAYFLPVCTLCDVSCRQKVTMSGGKHSCASLFAPFISVLFPPC